MLRTLTGIRLFIVSVARGTNAVKTSRGVDTEFVVTIMSRQIP